MSLKQLHVWLQSRLQLHWSLCKFGHFTLDYLFNLISLVVAISIFVSLVALSHFFNDFEDIIELLSGHLVNASIARVIPLAVCHHISRPHLALSLPGVARDKRAVLGTTILSLVKYSCLTKPKWSVPFDF